MIVSVPVLTSRSSARRLGALPGVALPPGIGEAAEAGGGDAGVEAAVAWALRALAVLAVALYHFGVPFMTGGFVGVDVFFVISGYLMTSIIVGGLEKDRFSILKFYWARAKRIIPALAFVCLASLILGWYSF